MMISRMPMAAEAAIQSSASRSVGLKTSGLRHGCSARHSVRSVRQAGRWGSMHWETAHVEALSLWPVVDGRRMAVVVRGVSAVQVVRRRIPERGDAKVPAGRSQR